MIYIIAIISLISSYYYIQDTNLLIITCTIISVITLAVAEMSLGRFIDTKFKNLLEYMEGHISVEEAMTGKVENNKENDTENK